MCTIRCLTLGLRSFSRCEVGLSVITRPRSSCLAYLNQTVYNNGVYKTSTTTRGVHFKQSLPTTCHVTDSCCKMHSAGATRFSSTQQPQQPATQDENEEPPKLSLFQRYKKMLKEYWYVLIPVHCVTSVMWFGCFYYAATCGVDIVPLLEYFGVSETLIKPLRSSSLGYLAVASAFYKLATPARYTVTLGGTTLAIRVLTKRGLIKPMPTKEKMKEMVKKKTDNFIQRKASQQ